MKVNYKPRSFDSLAAAGRNGCKMAIRQLGERIVMALVWPIAGRFKISKERMGYF